MKIRNRKQKETLQEEIEEMRQRIQELEKEVWRKNDILPKYPKKP